MASGGWYVNETNNSAGVYTKIWVTHGITASTFMGPYPSASAAKNAAQGLLGSQSLTGWQGDLAVLGGALGAAGSMAGGGSPSPSAISGGESAGESAGTSSLAGLADIGDLAHRLTEAATWERVGEVLLGGILLYAGVKALASGTAVGNAAKSATKPVTKAAKAGATVAAPEARFAGRVAAKKIAPKTTARVASHRAQVRQYGGKRAYLS